MSSYSMLSTIIFTYYSIQYVFGAPNIIFILTDDQDVALDSMQAMPKVKAEVQAKGITFNNAYANTPVCCPSRTETVSGRTYHNAKQSSIDCQGVSAVYNVYTNPNSLFNKFHSNNYVTGGFGKVTNNMDFCSGSSFNLDSFDRLHVSCDYHNFWTDTNFNKYVGDSTGSEETPTLMNAEDVYQTAQLGNATVNFIKEQLRAQRDNNALPFIIWVAPYAPHQPADPAVWYQNSFNDLELLKTPNYNPSDVSNYHIPISDNPQISSEAEKYMLLLYQDRLRSLLSVDDMVGEIVDAVDEYNAWDNTYLVYTSDHGYHIGQYRLPCAKYQPYEETTRIPLYVRGPGIDAGVETSAMVQNIDFLPTFIDLAGISYGDDDYDGRSFKQILENTDSYNTYNIDSNWRQTVMFEYKSIKGGTKAARFSSCVMWCPNFDNSPFGESCVKGQLPAEYILDMADNNYRVLRIKNASVNWFYGEFVSEAWDENAFENPIFYEFYDLDKDEWQLTNSYNDLSDEILQELHELVQSYGKCCGSDSCSPIGNNRPGEPAVCSASSTSSSSSGGGKSKAFSDISNYGFEDINGKNGLSAKDISFVLSGATIIGGISLVVGICVGLQIQKRYKTNMVMDVSEKL